MVILTDDVLIKNYYYQIAMYYQNCIIMVSYFLEKWSLVVRGDVVTIVSV